MELRDEVTSSVLYFLQNNPAIHEAWLNNARSIWEKAAAYNSAVEEIASMVSPVGLVHHKLMWQYQDSGLRRAIDILCFSMQKEFAHDKCPRLEGIYSGVLYRALEYGVDWHSIACNILKKAIGEEAFNRGY